MRRLRKSCAASPDAAARPTGRCGSAWRDLSIYYLYSPPPGTDNITGAATNNGNADGLWLQAYTLHGVDVQSPPLVGQINQNGVTSITLNMQGIPDKAYAAVGGLHSTSGGQAASITATDTNGLPSGVVNTSFDITDNATITVLGYVSDLTAGGNNFTFTESGSGGNKEALVAAIFAPSTNAPPPTISVQWSGTNLQLSWSQGTLLEATNVTGPWTTNTATSPFTVSPTRARSFYRVQVQ